MGGYNSTVGEPITSIFDMWVFYPWYYNFQSNCSHLIQLYVVADDNPKIDSSLWHFAPFFSAPSHVVVKDRSAYEHVSISGWGQLANDNCVLCTCAELLSILCREARHVTGLLTQDTLLTVVGCWCVLIMMGGCFWCCPRKHDHHCHPLKSIF